MSMLAGLAGGGTSISGKSSQHAAQSTKNINSVPFVLDFGSGGASDQAALAEAMANPFSVQTVQATTGSNSTVGLLTSDPIVIIAIVIGVLGLAFIIMEQRK